MGSPKETMSWMDHDGKVRVTYKGAIGRPERMRPSVFRRLARFAHKSRSDKLRSVQENWAEFARKGPRDHWESLRYRLVNNDWYWNLQSPGTDRTTYLIGLFGSGRWYVYELMLQHIGERAKYLRHEIRYRPGPTSMIYTEHATIKYVSRAQALPELTNRILGMVKERSADMIFVYRHPLDSLLTNWVFWREYVQRKRLVQGISQVYKSTHDLCADLERNFAEFKAFADGDRSFFATAPGAPFLSFPQFVEETELYIESATLSLRLEDFMADPRKEFSKIVEVMSVDLDVNRLTLDPPRSKPYVHRTVSDNVPLFRNFLSELDPETRRRMETIGYSLPPVVRG
jgi:hypothetical protein